MRFWCVLAAGLLAWSAGFADTLVLRNGKTVQGSYLGGGPRQIRMAVGDRVESFDTSDVSSLQFETSQPAQAQAAPLPQPAPEPQAAPTPQPASQAQAASQPQTAQPAVRAAAPEPAAESQPEGRRILRREPTASSAPAPAKPVDASGTTIPAGTEITVRMIDDVDSQVSRPGQTFKASVDEPVMVGDRTLIPRGADVLTKLIEVKDPSKLSGGGELTLALDSITVNGKSLVVTSEGVTTEGQSRKKETGAVVGGGAALGAIIGAIAGGGKGAAIGAVSGAGAGAAVQVLTKGTRVRVPSESRLTFTLQQPVRP